VGSKSGIEWTDATWNPVSGCTPVSEGCANCYAAAMAKRFPQTHGGWSVSECMEGDGEAQPVPFSTIVCHPERLDQPLHWRKPRVVFVCSMGDWLHEDVPREFTHRMFAVMKQAQEHTFLLLTRRIERVKGSGIPYLAHRDAVLPNVYLGVSAENQARFEQRVSILQETPAAGRFVSLEPLLGAITVHGLRGYTPVPDVPGVQFYGRQIDCVIAGCESGPGRRPAPHDWFRSIRDQCEEMEVPLFFKQMGENEDGSGRVVKLPELDGRVYAETPWAMSGS